MIYYWSKKNSFYVNIFKYTFFFRDINLLLTEVTNVYKKYVLLRSRLN